MKEQYGTTIFMVTLLALLMLPRPAPEQEKLSLTEPDKERLRKFGTVLRIVSDEMVSAANSNDIEEHLFVRAEQVFDDFAKESDFPGPDVIAKPLAKKMVRPVVKTVIRYAEQKNKEHSQKQYLQEQQ